MTYYKFTRTLNGKQTTFIVSLHEDGGQMVFPLTDDNPNKVAYDAWVAEGNTAEEWSPEA
jgi:hypothetical protein